MDGGVLTSVACRAASFFRSSDPRFAISLVVSVKLCLHTSGASIKTLLSLKAFKKKKEEEELTAQS